MRAKNILFVLAAVCVCAGHLLAQEPSPSLTLDDAIRLALQRNKNLKVVSYGRGIARANLLAARGQFDPAIVGNRTGSDTPEQLQIGSPQLFDYRSDYYSLGLSGQTPIGTTYAAYGSVTNERLSLYGYENNYLTFAGFTITQPLLKGFGFAANLSAVRIAKANRAIQDWAYRKSAIDTVTGVIIAYSNLQLAHDLLDVAHRSQEQAGLLLSANQKEYKVGSISQSDVITARYYAAAQEENILFAERSVRDAQNQLRELIGDETFYNDEPLFALAPAPVPDVTVNLREDLGRALTLRPDYQEARLGIVQNRATEAAALNGLLPQVDFVGGYGYNGVGSTLSASRQMVQDHNNPSYSAGVAVTLPITFAVGRGKYRAAKLTREQSEEALKGLEADIAVAVANAAGQIETTRKRVTSDQAAYDMAKNALAAGEKKKLAGTLTTLELVQQQGFVSSAETSLSYALASQRQAVATYDQVLGTTLESNHVSLAEK